MVHTIYLIRNDVNSRHYVGMTKQTIEDRFAGHVSYANSGEGADLQEAIREHGPESFTIFPIDTAEDRDEAYRIESMWIDRLSACEDGYNVDPGGPGPPAPGYGEESPRAELTEEEVREILRRYVAEDGSTIEEIARDFPVSRGCVNAVISGQSWPQVERPDGMKEKSKSLRRSSSKLDRNEVIHIRQKYVENTDLSANDLASEYGVSRGTITNLLRGDTYSDVPVPEGMEEALNCRTLPEQQVKEARRKYVETDITVGESARELGVNRSTAYSILSGETYSDVPVPDEMDDALASRPSGQANGNSVMTEGLVEDMRRRYEQEDLSYDDLEQQYPVSKSTAGQIIRRETWTHI